MNWKKATRYLLVIGAICFSACAFRQCRIDYMAAMEHQERQRMKRQIDDYWRDYPDYRHSELPSNEWPSQKDDGPGGRSAESSEAP